MRCWIDGHLLDDPTEARVRVDDHGLTVGDGVFEAVKVTGGRPFALTRHLDRLTRSARAIGLADPDLAEIRAAVASVLGAEHLDLGRLRITVTGGPAPLGSGRGSGPGTRIVAAGPLDPRPDATDIVVAPWPRNERGALAGVKTTSYAENVVALAHAQRLGASEAIFANLAGSVCEGTGSNVLYVVGGEVRTPTLASGCLAGISRELLLEWAPEIRVVDEPIEVLARAEEILLVSTTRDVQAVRTCEGRELEAPGRVTRDLMELWVRKEREGLDP